jgi:hypothetical protein
MALPDADLINGQIAEMFELGLGKVPSQKSAFDVFDLPPGDAQVIGYVLDRHALSQLQDVSLKGPRVTVLGHRKRDWYLRGSTTGAARDSWDSHPHHDGLPSDRHRLPLPLLLTAQLNLCRPTPGTTIRLLSGNHREDHLALLEVRCLVTVLTNPEGAIQ